jgi:peptide/nickel transport system permease protein
VALLVGFVSMGIAATIGISVGALAGYFGGWIDMLLSRLIEVVISVPSLVLILTLIGMLEHTTIWHIMAVLGCTTWTGIARLTRGEFLKLRESEFVTAAKALGAGPLRIIFRHMLPNAMAPVMVPITFGIAVAILIESGLSFLGFGDANNPSWGLLLNEGRSNHTLWWLIVFPGLAVFSAVLAYNLVGEGLQQATDPRLREAGK